MSASSRLNPIPTPHFVRPGSGSIPRVVPGQAGSGSTSHSARLPGSLSARRTARRTARGGVQFAHGCVLSAYGRTLLACATVPFLALCGAVPTVCGAAFLEPDVEVVYEILGEAAGGTFGFVVEPVGDLNGDGVAEFVTSAPYLVESGASVGKVYLLDGANGAILRSHLGQTPLGRFGFRLASGDFDGDGIHDYAASAPGDEGSQIDGEVFVYSGDLTLSNGTELLWHLESAVSAARLGRGLGRAGDLDADGRDDLLVGAPREDVDGVDSGIVYVYSGQTHGILRTHGGSGTQARLGQACRGVGDLNGDDVDDYVIGAPGGGTTGDGIVWAIDGSTGSILYSMEPDSPGAQEFGGFFANSPGDMSGDGVPDIFVGDYSDNSSGPSTGHTYLFDGVNGARFPYDVAGDSSGDWNGFGGRVLGDFDSDGRADFITNFFNNTETSAPRAGRVVIYSGGTGEVLRTVTSLEGTANGSYGEWFGYDVTGIGDVNGDGIPDLLVSAGLNGEAGSSAGKVYVVAGVWAPTATVPATAIARSGLELRSVTPNPFSVGSEISYRLSVDAPIAIDVFDGAGRLVRPLFGAHQRQGEHRVHWNGLNSKGEPVPVGVYYVRLRSGEDSVGIRTVRIE